jgi:hypothetical protein
MPLLKVDIRLVKECPFCHRLPVVSNAPPSSFWTLDHSCMLLSFDLSMESRDAMIAKWNMIVKILSEEANEKD